MLDCQCHLQWLKIELATPIEQNGYGQRLLRIEIKILSRLLEFMKAPELFKSKLQMIPANIQPKDTMNKTHYRQGDVLIERIASIPTTAIKQKRSRRIILAHGEVTGHHHALETGDPADWWKSEAAGVDAEQFVELQNGGILSHQEHAKIVLPPGNYRVTRQREYSPQELRNVQD